MYSMKIIPAHRRGQKILSRPLMETIFPFVLTLLQLAIFAIPALVVLKMVIRQIPFYTLELVPLLMIFVLTVQLARLAINARRQLMLPVLVAVERALHMLVWIVAVIWLVRGLAEVIRGQLTLDNLVLAPGAQMPEQLKLIMMRPVIVPIIRGNIVILVEPAARGVVLIVPPWREINRNVLFIMLPAVLILVMEVYARGGKIWHRQG
jgi:hypothetical protein